MGETVIALIALIIAVGGVIAQVLTLRHQRQQERRAATAMFVREIAAGPDSDPEARRDAWFRLRAAGVPTRAAVDGYAFEKYDETLRYAAAQWAVDEQGFTGWEVFGHTDGATFAQQLADAKGETLWRVTFFTGSDLISATTEADARREFLFSLGELAEHNPDDDRIRSVMAERVTFEATEWFDVPVPGVPAPHRQQPRTVVSLKTRDGTELLHGNGDGSLIAGPSVPPDASLPDAATQEEHERIRREFREQQIRFLGPFIPTRSPAP